MKPQVVVGPVQCRRVQFLERLTQILLALARGLVRAQEHHRSHHGRLAPWSVPGGLLLGIPSTVDLLAVHVVVGFKDGFGAAHSGTHASYEWYIDSKRIVLYKIRYTVNCARGPV